MQQVTLNFDARGVAPATAPEPVPTDWYKTIIVESEMKPTNDGNGAYLELKHQIIEGQFSGHFAWDRLNLQNQNPVAVEIAYRQLSAICHATGVMQVGQASQLHGIPMMTRILYKPAGKGKDGKEYDASNDIKGYKAIGAATPTASFPVPQNTLPSATAFAPPQAPAPVAAPSNSVPWAQPSAPAPAPAPAPAAPSSPPWAQAPVAPAPAPTPAPAPATPTPPWAQGNTAAPAATPPWAK